MSNDPVLQTRVLAYADAQRYRLGVNYQMLPINIPVCPFHNNHNDGTMNYMIKDEEVCIPITVNPSTSMSHVHFVRCGYTSMSHVQWVVCR